MKRVTAPLRAMGAAIDDTDGLPPIRVGAATHCLHGFEYAMPVASAQVKSALLLAGLYADGSVTIHEPAPTRDHTERMLRAMGMTVETLANDDGTSMIVLHPPSSVLRPLDMPGPVESSSAASFYRGSVLLSPHAHIRLVEVGLNPARLGLLDALKSDGCEHIHQQ